MAEAGNRAFGGYETGEPGFGQAAAVQPAMGLAHGGDQQGGFDRVGAGDEGLDGGAVILAGRGVDDQDAADFGGRGEQGGQIGKPGRRIAGMEQAVGRQRRADAHGQHLLRFR